MAIVIKYCWCFYTKLITLVLATWNCKPNNEVNFGECALHVAIYHAREWKSEHFQFWYNEDAHEGKLLVLYFQPVQLQSQNTPVVAVWQIHTLNNGSAKFKYSLFKMIDNSNFV